jgi:hypothetical protein
MTIKFIKDGIKLFSHIVMVHFIKAIRNNLLCMETKVYISEEVS